jgi:hypothetical protein
MRFELINGKDSLHRECDPEVLCLNCGGGWGDHAGWSCLVPNYDKYCRVEYYKDPSLIPHEERYIPVIDETRSLL